MVIINIHLNIHRLITSKKNSNIMESIIESHDNDVYLCKNRHTIRLLLIKCLNKHMVKINMVLVYIKSVLK